jgi:hypothetical protein
VSTLTIEPLTTFLNSPLQDEENLILRFQDDIASRGLVGECENAAIVLVVAVSAKLDNPLSLTVFGESSAGKNNLLDAVAAFLPEEMTKRLSGLTPKALCHMKEDAVEHKAVFIAEYEGVKGADYAIRTLQSEKFIRWEFVDTKKGVEHKTNLVRGPVAFLQATTRSLLHPENETRLLFIQIDESEAQTRAINARQAARYELGVLGPDDAVLTSWQAHIRSLELKNVVVPFARQVLPHFPAGRIRSRRDFPKLMGMIQASAFLHQHRREKQGDVIVASVEDYQIARKLFEHCYETGPDRKLGELLEAAEKLAAQGEFKAADIMALTGWKKSKAYSLLERAEELGCIAQGDGHGCYRFLRASTVPSLALPEVL